MYTQTHKMIMIKDHLQFVHESDQTIYILLMAFTNVISLHPHTNPRENMCFYQFYFTNRKTKFPKG